MDQNQRLTQFDAHPTADETHGNDGNESISIDSVNRVHVQIARDRSDLIGAFELLQRRYALAGLSDSSSPLRVLPYHLWSQTQVIVAKYRGKVIGSVSITRDGHRGGVPMESTYQDAIGQLRQQGTPFGEVCSLTVESPEGQSTGEIFGQITRLMMFHARFVGLDQLVAMVHPRHAKFYQRAMGFLTIGGTTQCQQVAGMPGVPILGHVNDRSHYRARWQRFYFDGHYSDAALKPHELGPSDVAFFQQYLPADGYEDRAAA